MILAWHQFPHGLRVLRAHGSWCKGPSTLALTPATLDQHFEAASRHVEHFVSCLYKQHPERFEAALAHYRTRDHGLRSNAVRDRRTSNSPGVRRDRVAELWRLVQEAMR